MALWLCFLLGCLVGAYSQMTWSGHILEAIAHLRRGYEEAQLENEQYRAERDALQQQLDGVRQTLADIGYSDDMTLTVARRKAKRAYEGTTDVV